MCFSIFSPCVVLDINCFFSSLFCTALDLVDDAVNTEVKIAALGKFMSIFHVTVFEILKWRLAVLINTN